MKLIISISTVILAFTTCVWFIIDRCVDTTHKYEVRYASGRYTYSDYTDTFALTPTSINYRNERGVEVIRFGTFSITNNQDYKNK
jgi:hypothetical protein